MSTTRPLLATYRLQVHKEFPLEQARRIVPYLVDQRTVYYFDLVGYGQSEQRAGQDVSLAVQNTVLHALFKEWGLERPDVLAHDFGGATALRGYYLNGLRYASLTIFDAVALAPWGSPFVQHVRQHEQAFAGMPDYMHRALLKAYLQSAAHQPLSGEAHVLEVEGRKERRRLGADEIGGEVDLALGE